jgi:hypothetical protein
MRYSTKLRLETYGILLAVYGGLSAGAAYVAWRIYHGIEAGQITFGKHGESLMVRATDPFWFWFAIVWHVFCLLAILAIIAYFARGLGHGPWKGRGSRGW